MADQRRGDRVRLWQLVGDPCALQREEEWPTPTESGRNTAPCPPPVAALSVQGHLIQPTLAMIVARPVLEEPSLAELPPTSGELKEASDRNTGLPLNLWIVQKV